MEETKATDKTDPMAVLEEREDKFLVRINYAYPESHPVVFANNLVVQHNDCEFLLSFYHLLPPPHSDDEEAKRQIEKAGGMQATCIARIAIPKDRMPSFVAALKSNLERFIARQQKSTDETNGSRKTP